MPPRIRSLSLLLVLISPLIASMTNAASISWLATGTFYSVTDTGDVFEGQISIDTPFTGIFQYDTSSIPYETHPDAEYYAFDPSEGFLSMSLFVGSIEAYSIPSGSARMGVQNDNAVGFDHFQLNHFDASSVVGNVTSLEVAFRDSTGTAFSDLAIPTSFDLGDFDTHYFGLTASAGEDLGVALGEIQSLTLIPEPGTAALLAFGLAALSTIRRRG